jgi:CRISPR-associated protein (TIGR02584 family)
MAYQLHYALSVFGRPQDRLTYALASPEWESRRDLFYPRPGEPDETAADIEFVDIPFVRLRVSSTTARM